MTEMTDYKVLIFEDSSFLNQMIQLTLKGNNISSIGVESLTEGLPFLVDTPLQLVIISSKLITIETDQLHQLRKLLKDRKIPVLVISDAVNEISIEKILENISFEVLIRPVSPQDILDSLRPEAI